MTRRALELCLLLGLAPAAACSEDVVKKAAIDVPFVDPGNVGPAWALIPAGPFFEGDHHHPAEIARPYEMMVNLVTNAELARYLDDAVAAGRLKIVDGAVVGHHGGDRFDGYRHETEIPAGEKIHLRLGEPGLRIRHDGTRFSSQPGFENHPAVMVSWFGAQAYCESQGWRLPTEKEWEKAARGDDRRAYPWGDTIARNQANYYASGDPYEELFGKQGGTTPVGYYNGKSHGGYQTERAVSPHGLYDMVGNVWQWMGDDYPDMHYRWLRGGSHGSYDYDLRVWSRNSVGPEHYGVTIGFRCSRAPVQPQGAAGRSGSEVAGGETPAR